MRLLDVINLPVDINRIEDCKGNRIPFYQVKELKNWNIYSTDVNGVIKIIAPEAVAKKFYKTLVETRKAKQIPYLLTEKEIFNVMEISPFVVRALLWSCSSYGITQREKPFDANTYYWVIE